MLFTTALPSDLKTILRQSINLVNYIKIAMEAVFTFTYKSNIVNKRKPSIPLFELKNKLIFFQQ